MAFTLVRLRGVDLQGQKKPAAPKVEPTPAELQFRRNSKYWLLGAGAAVAAYILMSGKYVQVRAG